MKKLTIEESNSLFLKSKGRQTNLSAMLMTLQVGEAMMVAKTEWAGKRSPYYVANYIAKKMGWKFENGQLPNKEAWVMKRIA